MPAGTAARAAASRGPGREGGTDARRRDVTRRASPVPCLLADGAAAATRHHPRRVEGVEREAGLARLSYDNLAAEPAPGLPGAVTTGNHR